MFLITAAGCAAGQGNVTGTDAETEEDTGSDVPTVGSGSLSLNYNGSSVSALGYAELDGDQIYSPFLLEEPDYTLDYDAKRVVAGMSGDIIAVFTISSPGVTFNTAKVTFKVSGIKNGDRLYVFSKAGGSWNRVEASVVGDKHVLVTLYGNGPLLFFKRNSL